MRSPDMRDLPHRDAPHHAVPRRVMRLIAVAALAGALAGCSSILSEMPQAVGGLPEGVPDRPATAPGFPSVNDLPRQRSDAPLTEAERKKVVDDLAAARAAAARRAAGAP